MSHTAGYRQDSELPQMRQLSATERYGRTCDGSDHGCACSRQEGLHARVGSQSVEVCGTSDDEHERRCEGDQSCEQAATESTGGVAHDSYRLDDGSRSDLTEGYCVQKLGSRHPVIRHHGVMLHQRDDHEAAAIGQRPNLQHCDPTRRQPKPPTTGTAAVGEKRVADFGEEFPELLVGRDLDHPARRHQDEHGEAPTVGRRSAADQEITSPTDLPGPVSPRLPCASWPV